MYKDRHKEWRAILTSQIQHSTRLLRNLPSLNGVGSILKESSSILVNCFSLDQWSLALLTNADEPVQVWDIDEVMPRREMFLVVIDFIRSQKRYHKACLTSSMENEEEMES